MWDLDRGSPDNSSTSRRDVCKREARRVSRLHRAHNSHWLYGWQACQVTRCSTTASGLDRTLRRMAYGAVLARHWRSRLTTKDTCPYSRHTTSATAHRQTYALGRTLLRSGVPSFDINVCHPKRSYLLRFAPVTATEAGEQLRSRSSKAATKPVPCVGGEISVRLPI